uniref:Nucleoporin NUP188 homolog n=1 Tax=Angiostrongylus cantonensis TaxID=6313 RepID=A0A158PB65_ANGCA
MWIEVRRACETVQNFEDLESSTACSDLIKEIEKFKWRIQNILRNQGKSASDRAKLKADSEVVIDGVKVPVSQALCNEAFVISDIFNLNEMEALELVLSGESQKIHFDCLSRGLIAVVCYYDMHRLLAVILRMVLEWEKDSMSDVLRSFIEQNFVQRAVFQQLLQLQATFNVITEFHMLSQPNVCGLGGPRHQTLLRNVIEEIRENCAESLYSLCEWGSEHANEFLADIYPILKSVPLAEKFSAHHLSAWMCLMKLTSSNVLSQTNSVAVVLTNLVKEIRNETLWSDQSVCGTVQLQCAVSLRALAVSPADHLSITNVEVDVDKVVDRAIRNMAMLFIRHGIVGADSFKLCATHVRVVDTLLKQLIALFPAKLMEIERNSEDELTWVDEMSEKGQQATPALYYENFLRCIPDLYRVVDDPEASAAVKTCVMELSTSYSSSGSLELCRFMERARLPHHVVHAVAYLDFLCSVCLTQQVSSFIFDIFARVPPNDDGCIGWDHVMSALRSYERLFRERSGVVSMFGHSLPTQQQSKADIPPRELIGLITWVNLARTVVDLDDEAAEVFLEERQWAVLDAALGVVSAPVPLLLKGALLRLVAALAKKESSALRIWNALNAHRLCTFAENGTLLGLQRELDERECVEEMFDTSLGFVSILRSLLSHPYIAVPDFAAPYLQYLTKSIVSQMASRSYKDIEQFYELEEISLSALLFLLKQSYVNSRAVLCKEPHVALLAQILNDTPVYRAICSVLIEDVNIQDQTARSYRRTSAPALPAIHLLSGPFEIKLTIAVSRYAVLRASIRASDSDMMLAPLHALLLSPLQPSGLNILDIVLLYIEEADDLPCHALYAARILRELCAIRPSLQSHMVELLRARKMVARNARAIRSVLNPSSIRYTVSDMVALDSVETDPAKNNLCFLLFGFKTTTDGSGQLYDVESQPTGFHQVLSILEQFVAAQNPLQLPFSALIEPSFRLLDDSEGPARLSVTRMISGSILHLTALEISSLLKTGHFNKPQEMYSALLEASEAVTCHQEELEAGVDNLLFSLLRHGRIELSEEIAYPRLVHFNAHRLHMLFDTCKTTTVFNIAQYDIEYLHVLLVREIVSTQAEDTTTVTREMEAVLTYGTDVNSQLLQRGASEQLVSGCTALLNVMALFAPVPFFSIASQLDMLTDAAFLLVEYVSGCGADEQVAVCTTLMRLCKAICRLASQRYSEVRLV